MDWTSFLLKFFVFAVVVICVFYAVQWIMSKMQLDIQIQKIVYLILGAIAFVGLITKFVIPLFNSI